MQQDRQQHVPHFQLRRRQSFALLDRAHQAVAPPGLAVLSLDAAP